MKLINNISEANKHLPSQYCRSSGMLLCVNKCLAVPSSRGQGGQVVLRQKIPNDTPVIL